MDLRPFFTFLNTGRCTLYTAYFHSPCTDDSATACMGEFALSECSCILYCYHIALTMFLHTGQPRHLHELLHVTLQQGTSAPPVNDCCRFLNSYCFSCRGFRHFCSVLYQCGTICLHTFVIFQQLAPLT